jgi:hypothetical protein
MSEYEGFTFWKLLGDDKDWHTWPIANFDEDEEDHEEPEGEEAEEEVAESIDNPTI